MKSLDTCLGIRLPTFESLLSHLVAKDHPSIDLSLSFQINQSINLIYLSIWCFIKYYLPYEYEDWNNSYKAIVMPGQMVSAQCKLQCKYLRTCFPVVLTNIIWKVGICITDRSGKKVIHSIYSFKKIAQEKWELSRKEVDTNAFPPHCPPASTHPCHPHALFMFEILQWLYRKRTECNFNFTDSVEQLFFVIQINTQYIKDFKSYFIFLLWVTVLAISRNLINRPRLEELYSMPSLLFVEIIAYQGPSPSWVQSTME